jgi:SAM-dependent methyltransferase
MALPRRIEMRLPPVPPRPKAAVRLGFGLAGLGLAPFYWLLAHRWQTPGLRFHLDSAILGLRVLASGPRPLPASLIFRLFVFPMDATRYFEIEFMWRALRKSLPAVRYLDVSSPRLLPLLLLRHRQVQAADLLNPDAADLADTEIVVRAAGLSDRCRLHHCRLEDSAFAPASYDTITSLSVIEHVPDGRAFFERLWALLRPGGRLLLSVPCAAQAVEQYVDRSPYGLLTPDERGFFFWQRLYDSELLQAHFYAIAGQPRRLAIRGERRAGFFEVSTLRKRTDHFYPLWCEPDLMGREFTVFTSLADLPGEGVIALEFVKQ